MIRSCYKMLPSKIISTALEIHHLTKLNTYIIDQNGELIFYKEDITIPSFMPGASGEDIFYFYQKIKQNKNYPYCIVNDWDLYYLGYSCSIGQDLTIIIGPFMRLTPNLFSLTKEYSLSSYNRETLEIFCNQIQVLNGEIFHSYSRILQLFDQLIEKDIHPIEIRRDTNNYSKESFNTYEKPDEKEGNVVNLRYRIEKEILHAVKQGNKAKAIALYKSNNILWSFSERFPNQPLRRSKNLAIVFNTLLRSAARESQVPPILIHRLSEKYALEIESKNRLSKLTKLYEKMINEYCDLINQKSLAKYSTLIQKTVEYIMKNYNKKIDTEKLAAKCFIHPSHLARKFKQETGETITSYQQNFRINQAKFLLKNENLPIEEISWIVGYEDPSYFARVFKRRTGVTPTQYKKS